MSTLTSGTSNWAQRVSSTSVANARANLSTSRGILSRIKENYQHLNIGLEVIEKIDSEIGELYNTIYNNPHKITSPTMMGITSQSIRGNCRKVEQILAQKDPELEKEFKEAITKTLKIAEDIGVTGSYRGI